MSVNRSGSQEGPFQDGRERVAIVDSQHASRLGISHFLSGSCGLEIAWTVASAEEAMPLIKSHEPDLLVTEISLPGKDGLHFIKEIIPVHPHLKILVHSVHSEEFYAERCLRAGAMGYLHKTHPMEDFRQAVETILHGGIHVNPRLGRQVFHSLVTGSELSLTRAVNPELTDRELEIMILMGEGTGCREIATRLAISPKTVQVHRNNIRGKLGVESVLQLQAHAVRFYAPRSPVACPSGQQGEELLGSETLRRFLDRYP